MRYFLWSIFAILWILLLRVLGKAELYFWRFLSGSCGLFLLLFFLMQPLLTEPLGQCVAAIAGVFGNLTGTFSPYFRYGVLFIEAVGGTMTLQIDFECSGIVEIIAYLSLLAFYRVYTRNERVILMIVGIGSIILANVLRIIVICEMIHFGGTEMYYVAHSLVGRLVFYTLSVLLYFYVFTKPQIIRMKVGGVTYGKS